MIEINEDEKRLEALKHTFCSPKNIKLKDSKEFKSEIENSTANAYDLVLNGLELGIGWLRIHQSEIQRELLTSVGLTDKKIISQTSTRRLGKTEDKIESINFIEKSYFYNGQILKLNGGR